MTDVPTNQLKLRLVSKLYDLASQFADADLHRILRSLHAAQDHSLVSAIKYLIDLHSPGTSQLVSTTEDRVESLPVAAKDSSREAGKSPSAARRREAAFKEMLLSKEAFPSTNDIAVRLPFPLPVRNKESRINYVNRIITRFRLMSENERDELMKAMYRGLSSASGASFMTRWSNFIKDL